MKNEKPSPKPIGVTETIGGGYHRFESDFRVKSELPATAKIPQKTAKPSKATRKKRKHVAGEMKSCAARVRACQSWGQLAQLRNDLVHLPAMWQKARTTGVVGRVVGVLRMRPR